MSIFDQIRGDRVPLQMFGASSDRQILSPDSDAFGKYLPSDGQDRFVASPNLADTSAGGAGAGLDCNGNQTPFSIAGSGATPDMTASDVTPLPLDLDSNGNQTVLGAGNLPAVPLRLLLDSSGDETPVTAIRADGSGDETPFVASSPDDRAAPTGAAQQISANDAGLLAAMSTAYANRSLSGLFDRDALSLLV